MKKIKGKNRGTSQIEGIISITSKGTGYVKVEGQKKDVEINYKNLNTALHGDKVNIIIESRINDNPVGIVRNIIKRAKNGFSGVIEKENEIYFLNPDDNKMYTDILIPKNMLSNAKIGEKVYAEITSWNDPLKSPIGKVVKVLGMPGENNTEMHSIAIEKGFDLTLPKKVEHEASLIKKKGIQSIDYKGRRDFRNILTFTIDPYDAKDFDDAISFKEIDKNKFEIGIHIADVSHYIKEDSILDIEAKKRGTSVYLVDRTIPMLPEVLSNDLCSLIPEKDRLTMSAVFTIDNNAKILNEWYGKTIIKSEKRFTYEEAFETIKNKEKQYHKELNILNNIAKKLSEERFENGAIYLDQEEIKFILDKNGKPIKIIKKERTDSNKLIEEFMLLANKKVAEKMSKNIKGKDSFIYRIHDLPSKEKSLDLSEFLKSLGYSIKLKNGIISSKEINKIIENSNKKDTKDTIHKAIIRSMAKAIYSTKNIGHYGLAFSHYTHFTSPIRRYPDIIVHRSLSLHLNNKEIQNNKKFEYEEIAISANEQEKKATEAERSSIKYKQIEFMYSRLNESMTGIITGINEWGIFVEELETKCEGMIRLRDLNDDYYIYNEKKIELIGKKTNKKYKFGDKIKIKIKKVDLEKKIIDYINI